MMLNPSANQLPVPISNSPGDGVEFRYNATALDEYKQEERYQKKSEA
jgi:hypothetical protein